MFKWLTRKDGEAAKRAKRRITSPRGSVFTEFALVMPVVLLLCSALVELLGYWDAQVMANHTAWQVGRIAMVRGADGMKFSAKLDEKSSTGIVKSSMPESLKSALKPFENALNTLNLFNDRGNITALFMMSTCGIGYFGASPGKTFSTGFKELLEGGMDALTKGIPDLIKEAANQKINLPSLGGYGTTIENFIKSLITKVIDKIVDAAITPVTNAIAKLLTAAVEKIFGEQGAKLDDFFNNSRTGRQLFGAASRIARSNRTIGCDVVVVSDMTDDSRFVFAKAAKNGYLVYPEVVDKSAKSDGYFVSGAHGWPPNEQAHSMISVEVNWPYEQGWLFPVVSGYGGTSSAPAARGHSMVFPQPDISSENLYSVGATEYAEGDYKKPPGAEALEGLVGEMTNYLRRAQFCMKFRICQETLTKGDEAWYSYSWKNCIELKKLFNIGLGKGEGDYALCWNRLTDGLDQDELNRNLEPFFKPESYHNRDYFHWDGSYHSNYRPDLCNSRGDSGLGLWYEINAPLTYRCDNINAFSPDAMALVSVYSKYKARFEEHLHPAAEWSYFVGGLTGFSKRNKVNISNLSKWLAPDAHEKWAEDDEELHLAVTKADKAFSLIYNLICREIEDLQKGIDGEVEDMDDPSDPVFDKDDMEFVKDPESAAKRAKAKWDEKLALLRAALRRVDAAAKDLRSEWIEYKAAVEAFRKKRREWTGKEFAEAVARAMLASDEVDLLAEDNFDSFLVAFRKTSDGSWIAKDTKNMLKRTEKWMDKLNAAYEAELEYGSMIGLRSAKKRKSQGSDISQAIDSAEGLEDEKRGSLSEGSDTGEIIDRDRQTYGPGGWQWR